ncbi:3-keto-disaccharide hydrolase [Novipirellula artificiosorum]|uniref:3-keto-alpha-glucoside-1,2-lyase/3-keto-2-hydroxy-glucal hydratase domain-containing protein n=1 Tax=Novipirellula artificiosorum TaxID=2528016 RepID=A0A5C6DVA7_9BACT|nr:DUF1080 domain-containing protein [Novipirellula artificiosorum]TWU40548.1 hypothetical protein Poly41_13810 [Novipirellula artificiosorum]
MRFRTLRFLAVASLLAACCPTATHAQDAPKRVWTDPAEAGEQDPDFLKQGEYVGNVDIEGESTCGAQVVALGKGQFAATLYVGGLPGDGWNGNKHSSTEASIKDDGSIVFESEEGIGILKDGVITIVENGEAIGKLKRVERRSETLGKQPPQNAKVLFDGTTTDQWDHAVMDGKLLAFAPREKGKSGTSSKEKFGSHSVHVEFRLPYMPEARGQARGNSGIYLQGRYEVQMLDSFGLEGEDNECGGIYKISKPNQNLCYPPLVWQTYDIDFTAAEYNNEGELVKHPNMTVLHNGVVIHQDLELPHHTTAAPNKAGPEKGPIFLQDHGNPVRYRNIWVTTKR